MKLNELITIVVDKAIQKGVVYLINMSEEPKEFLPCIHCQKPTQLVLCPICKIQMGIFAFGSETLPAYYIHMGEEVEVTTGWPVRDPAESATNQ